MLGVFCDADLLRETADLLGCVVDVDNLAGSLPASPELDDAFDDVADVLARRGGGPMGDVTRLQDNLLAAIARAARLDHHLVGRSRSFATSQRIVDVCLDLVRSTRNWQPSTVDLCRAAGMSERRVRSAFLDVAGMPPNRYFRAAALNQARTLLRQGRKGSTTVTEVLGGLGIYHLSHFARNYSELFGELPSDTLGA
jgi:AraC-like DNA-binding protein